MRGKMTAQILIVGTGLTGALTANLLHSHLPNSQVTVWDKAKDVGGRMTTSKSPQLSSCMADLGAQYITTKLTQFQKNQWFYSNLIESNIISPLTAVIEGMRESTDDVKHFVAINGMSSIVKFLLSNNASVEVNLNHFVNSLEILENKFRVSSSAATQNFDVVVLTMPVPQINEQKYIQNISPPDTWEKLQQVKYSSRYALIFFYDTNGFPYPDWSAKYLNHKIFRYVSIDNKKRGQSDEPAAVIFHTSIEFGSNHVDKTPEMMKSTLVEAAKELFPDWPEPVAVKPHKWRYSQVLTPYSGTPGCVVLKSSPLLIVGGDGFSESNVDGCIFSANAIVNQILKHVNDK